MQFLRELGHFKMSWLLKQEFLNNTSLYNSLSNNCKSKCNKLTYRKKQHNEFDKRTCPNCDVFL